jgi:hypothetical protein
MKNILYIVLISIFSLTVVSCSKKDSSSSSSSSPKKITGTLGTGYSVNRSASSRFASSSSDNSSQTANQVWAIPISRTKPYEGTSNVSLNYSIMLQEGHASKMGRQIFNIASDGTFALDVYLNCNPTSTMECLGYVFVLVDSTKTEKKDQIIGFLSLGGTESLVSIPVSDLKNDLDMGTVNQGSYDNDTGDNASDEAIGKTIDETADKFATFTSDQLKVRASADDYVKMIKNIYVNGSSNYSELSFMEVRYKYMSKVTNDVFTDFDNATGLGIGLAIFVKSTDTMTADGSKSYTLIPPGSTFLKTFHDNGTVNTSVEYSSTNPFVLDGDSDPSWGKLSTKRFDVGDMYWGNGYYLSTLPEGYWLLNDNNSSTIGYYDISLVNPIGSDNISNTYVPSIKLETNSDSKVSKVHMKWYLHNGTSYYEITDLTSFWANTSRVTLGVGDQTYNLIGSNKTELTLTTPVTNPSVKLQYGFYGAEIEVKYSY